MAIDTETEAAIERLSWPSLAALLRTALASQRASERVEARAALRERVVPRGASSEASAPVASILARALPSAPPDDAAALIASLAQLAYAVAPDGVPQGAAWARATHRACWLAEPTLLAWLATTRDDDVLVQLPFALVALTEGAGDGLPEELSDRSSNLDAKAREHALAIAARARGPATDEAHASSAFALGRLARRVPELLPALRGALARASWPVRVASAIGVLRVAPGDEAATDVIVEALRLRDQHATWTSRRFPWHVGHLRFFLVAVLAGDHVSDAGFARALPVLVDLARRDASAETIEDDVLRPLVRALEGTAISPGTRRADLPRAALALLDALYDNPALWQDGGAGVDALRGLGLAPDVRAWRSVLERS